MKEPANPPMGRLDAFDVGPKKLTVQTEFFSRPLAIVGLIGGALIGLLGSSLSVGRHLRKI